MTAIEAIRFIVKINQYNDLNTDEMYFLIEDIIQEEDYGKTNWNKEDIKKESLSFTNDDIIKSRIILS